MRPTRSGPPCLLRGSLRADDLGHQAEFGAAVKLLDDLFPPSGNVRTDVGDAKTIAGCQIVERQQ